MDIGRRRSIGVGIWGLGLVLAFGWSSLSTSSVESRGIGYAKPVWVSPVEPGRLMTLTVGLHDEVVAGDVVARLDPAALLEEREVVSAQLLAIQERQAAEAATEARRFAQGLEGTLLDRARVATDLYADRAAKQALLVQLSIQQDLSASGATSANELLLLQNELAIIDARIVAGENALGVANDAAMAARTRNEGVPTANEWEVVAAARELEQVDGRLARLDLMADIDGQVTWIYHTPGEVVNPGDAVLEIKQLATQRVLAYVSPGQVPELEPGEAAKVIRASGEVLDGELVSVGSGPREMPSQLWHNPAYPEWGVPVQIQLIGTEVAPDEPLTIRL